VIQPPRIVNFNTEGETEFHWNGSNRQSSNFAYPLSGGGDILNARLQQTTSPVDVDQAINDWRPVDSVEVKANNMANTENPNEKDDWETAVQSSATGKVWGDSNTANDAWETAPVANTYTQGVNFINIIRTNISYGRHFSSYILALLKNSYEKRARITLMKLTKGQTVQSETQQNGAWDNDQPEVYESGQGDVYRAEEYDTAAASNDAWETPAPIPQNDDAWGTVTEENENLAENDDYGNGFDTVNTDDDGSIAWGSQENFDVDWGTAHEIVSPENQV